MFQKKLKQMGAWILALSMVLGSSQLPAMGAKAADQNLALDATATASGVEDNASNLQPGKVNDGDMGTRWASPVSSDAQWLQLSWESSKTMKSFVVNWERRNATSYTIEKSDDGSSWTAVATFSAKPAQKKQEIILPESIQAKAVRLYIATHDQAGLDTEVSWNNVSVYEFEVYEGDIPDGRSEMQKLADSLSAPEISEDGSHISMPDVPEGVTVRFCADYEQVIGEDGTVYTPVQNKAVKGFFEVNDGTETQKSSEFTVNVPGQYTDGEDANEKPAVIPELQEWHGLNGKFLASSSSRIIVGSSKLMEAANIFAEDYRDVTGMDINVVSGTQEDAQRGDFYLTLNTTDEGLGKEGYCLNIGDIAVVEAEQTTGAYWGVVSILQILKQTKGSIPKGIARDYPKYEVRGFSIDVGRKPFTMETLKVFGKNMSWYKMNNLQVHLSDNLIFMEDYPTMEQAIAETYAGFRLESGVVNEETGKSATSEDVYYTKDEFRTFIKDSRVMGLDIVPEFDMPAHALPFTKAFQQYMSKKPGGHGYLIDEVDIANPEAIEWAKSIWADYFEGDDPIFDKETTVHIGTDEYHGKDGQEGRELFRKFSDEMIKFVQGTGRTVRMWGSLSNKTGTTPVASKDVQLNIWNTGYANPGDMYNLGYDLINTLEGPNYIVPAAGYYNNYINAQSIYNNWKPNVIGNLTLSAGDDQMLGACYAIWHDSIDTRANGISEYDSFDRFFQPLAAYSAKLWGEAADRNYSELLEVFDNTGTAPNTNMYAEVDSVSNKIVNYTFDNTLDEDSSANSYDLTDRKNVKLVNSNEGKALCLVGGESYVETPLNKIGMGAALTIKVKMDADAEGEQILCESKDSFGIYGTYALKASQKHTGKVGFSREGYDYSFNYTLPKGEWVELTFQGGKDNVSLYVNGELKDDNPDIYFANHETTELSAKLAKEGIIKTATMLIPIGYIGSTANSFKGQIEYVTVTSEKEISGNYSASALSQNEIEAGACSTHPTEGSYAAMLDGDRTTYWHTDWSSANEKDNTKDHNHYITLTFKNHEAKAINMLSYLPRQDNVNGRIYQYSIDITKKDGTVLNDYASGTWAADMSEKFVVFDSVEAKSVKLNILTSDGNHGTAAEMNLYNVAMDKDSLTAILSQYEDYTENDYTDISWKAFEKAKEVAVMTANSPESTQKDFMAVCEQLQRAAGNLTEKPAANRLSDGVKEAAQIQAEDYASAGYALYQQAVTDAAKVLNKENATEQEILQAAKSIENAKEGLANIGEIKSALADEVDLSNCTENSKAVYEKAVAAANGIVNDANATRIQAEEVLSNLHKAKAGLVDLSEMKAEVVAADAKDLSNCSTASANIYNSARESAKAVLNKPDATQAEIDAALAALNTAEEGLVEKTESEKYLSTEIANAEKQLTNLDGYTTESVEEFKKALEDAKEILNKLDATQEQMETAMKNLQNVKLVKKEEPKPNPGNNDTPKPPVTGPSNQKPVPKAGAVSVTGGVQYKVTKSDAKNGTVTVSKLTDTKKAKITIPSTVTIDGYSFRVTAIAAKAFQNSKKLTSVTIGANVTNIGSKAFYKCGKLNKVIFKGSKAPKIGKQAFKGTSSKCKITVPKKMAKKQLTLLKSAMKKAGMSKKAAYRK